MKTISEAYQDAINKIIGTNSLNPKQANLISAMWLPIDDVELRCELYREYGINIGKNCFIDYGVWIEPGAPSTVTIENNVVISHGAKILGHDSSLNNIFDFPIKIANTILKENCYIGTGAIILPGVTVGKYSIIGAGSVVTKDIDPGMIYIGNPASPICTVGELLLKNANNLLADSNKYISYESKYRIRHQDKLRKENINVKLRNKSQIENAEKDKESIISLELVNLGDEKISSFNPYPIYVSYHWLDLNDNIIEFDGLRTPLNIPLLPNNKSLQDITVRFPDEAGKYVLKITLVQEECFWFDEISKNYAVEIDVEVFD